jgi:lipopolysaccharide/colanic/teichoic acid biosynthesis glycosyltransferase
MIRLFDILFSILGIIILLPVLIIIYILIIAESKGGGFYIQKRVGKDGIDFNLLKFRSMRVGSDRQGLITVRAIDARMTRMGVFIRRFKLDELPQLFNVLIGDMSLVGPRPELRAFVALYNSEQLEVLSVRPGITDYASIEYVDENSILGSAIDPEKVYVEQIMPDKIRLNMRYIQNQNVKEYFHIIFVTIWHIVKKNKLTKETIKSENSGHKNRLK